MIREFETSDPSPGDLAKVVEAIRTENVKTIFVEPQFNGVAAERIAKMSGVKVGHLDPLGDGDWFKMMKGNLDALVSGLSEGEPVKPAGGKSGAAVEYQDVSYSYPQMERGADGRERMALDRITLTVNEGERLGSWGPMAGASRHC